MTLGAWLAERIDVVRAEQTSSTGAIHVQYDDGGALRGRFLRALRDELYALDSRPAVPFGVQPIHSLRGRVRVRVQGVGEGSLFTLALMAAAIPGVTKATHLPDGDTVLLFYDATMVSEERLLEVLRNSDPRDGPGDVLPPRPLRWGLACFCTSTLLVAISRTAPFPVIATSVILNTLRPLRRTLESLSHGQAGLDLLDVVATFAALATHRPVTASLVVWMVAVGDLLLDLSARSARNALSKLLQRKEQQAFRVLGDGTIEQVPLDKLEIGDRFIVPARHEIVADGWVLSGSAEVDEKSLTGESRLLSKRAGARVFASTVVVEGQIVVEVEVSGKNTQAAKIEKVLATIGSKPMTLERDAFAFANRLVVPSLVVAGLAGVVTSDVRRTVCVLITDFGTGIRIAVPTTALTAMALSAREGVLVKGAQYLERLSKTDTIVFDKTGTLTMGVPEVVAVMTAKGLEESTLIKLCASAEARHQHPVARALRAYAEKKQVALVEPELDSEKYDVGLGISVRVCGHRTRVGRASWMQSEGLSIKRFERQLARFHDDLISTLCVAVDDEVVGLIGYSDGARPESAAIVRKLQANGRRRVVLLSGDSPEVVKNVASELGIDEAEGGLLPEQKADYVRALQAAGHVVAMVGDGINDAPALAAADVGISIAGSSEVAIEAADVVLLEGGLTRLARAFAISERAMESLGQNLGIVIVPNAIAICLGALGLIQPPLAAIINNGSTIVAVLVGALPLLATPTPRLRTRM